MTSHADRKWGKTEPPRVTSCKGCGRPIIWIVNDTTGKAAPIDASPAANGPIVFVDTGIRIEYHVLRSGEVAPPERSTYTNHFQTCPQRQQFQKRGGRST